MGLLLLSLFTCVPKSEQDFRVVAFLQCFCQILAHFYNDQDTFVCMCVGMSVKGLQKLVHVAAYKEEFARWCDATVKSLHTNINGTQFMPRYPHYCLAFE